MKNRERKRKVPKSFIKSQSVYNEEKISEICKNIGIKFIPINTKQDINSAYQTIKSKIK